MIPVKKKKRLDKGKQKPDETKGDDAPEPGPVVVTKTKDKGREIFDTDLGLRWLKRQCMSSNRPVLLFADT
jgi:hypothetical protein